MLDMDGIHEWWFKYRSESTCLLLIATIFPQRARKQYIFSSNIRTYNIVALYILIPHMQAET